MKTQTWPKRRIKNEKLPNVRVRRLALSALKRAGYELWSEAERQALKELCEGMREAKALQEKYQEECRQWND
jgi:hypothetical protein